MTTPTGRRVTGTEFDDGQSRQFVDDPGTARQCVAQVLARRDGWAEIRPAHWAAAGEIVRALTAAGWLRTWTERRKYKQDQEQQAKGVGDGQG